MNHSEPLFNLQILGVPSALSDERCAALRQFLRDTHATHVAQMITIEPENPPYLTKVTEQMSYFQPVADRLGDVTKGILIQTLLGHGDRGAALSLSHFQRMIGLDGSKSLGSYCPLDREFRDHIKEACRVVSQAGPSFILFDDDVRYLWHGPSNRACFCPLHLSQFSAISKNHWSLAALRESLMKDDSDADTLRREWVSMVESDLLHLFDELSATIFAVDRSIQLGFCYTRDNRFFARSISQILGRHSRPIMRTHGPVYQRESLKMFPVIIDDIVRQKNELPPGTAVICEADSYPHTPFHTSAKFLNVLISSALMNGFDGWKAWLVDLSTFLPEERKSYTRLFQDNHEFWQRIREIAPTVSWRGAAVPLHQTRDELCTEAWDDYPSDGLAYFGWTSVLGRLGIPLALGQNIGGVVFLTKESASILADETLREILGRAVIMDGSAAVHLSKRGFSEMLGVKAEDDPDFRCHYEEIADDQTLNGWASRRLLLTIRGMPNQLRKLEPIAPKVNIAGWYLSTPYYGSKNTERLRPSATAYENPAGGRVVVLAGDLKASVGFVNAERKWQLESLITWCTRNAPQIIVNNPLDVLCLQGRLPNGADLLYLANLSPDDWPSIELRSSGGNPKSIRILREDGKWLPLPFTTGTDWLALDYTLKGHSILLLSMENEGEHFYQ